MIDIIYEIIHIRSFSYLCCCIIILFSF